MAPYANKKKVSAPGVSFAGTGVNQGGNTARPKALHGGLASSRSGGANSSGTMKKYIPRLPKPPKLPEPPKIPGVRIDIAPPSWGSSKPSGFKPVGSGGTHTQPVQGPSRPTTIGKDGFKQVTPTLVKTPLGKAAPKPAPELGDVGGYAPIRPKMLFIANGRMYYSNGVGGYSQIPNPTQQQLKSASKKAPAGWDPTWLSARPRPAGTRPAGTGGIAPNIGGVTPLKPTAPSKFSDLTTWDDPYKAAIAQAGYQYDLAGRPIAALDQELEANKQRWSAGLEGLFRSTNQNAYADNASLAARGIFNSGERINQDEARALGFTSSLGELNTAVGGAADPRLAARYANLGPGRAQAISTQRNEINSDRDNQKKLAVQEAEAAALQRAIEQYVIDNPPATPVGGQSDGQGGTVKKKAIDRAKVGWFTKGKDVYFRNEWGDEAKVDPTRVNAAWKKNTKRAA